MPAALPPDTCAIVVPAAESAVPTCFVGLAIHGDRQGLEVFLQAARKRSIRGKMLEGEPLEAMVLFTGAKRSDAFALLRDVAGGRFGQLKVGLVVAPASAASDGLEMDEMTVEPPNYLGATE